MSNLRAGWEWLVIAMPWVLYAWKRALVLHYTGYVGVGVRSFVVRVSTVQHHKTNF